ncbi:hypothetical protein HAHE_21050 [Haloferula helveola]|uniref:Ricin B lectin domain-containing protein n=1 Tax=Haloferula helveola TaxID=490095 RepID=A0ABM7RA32_9BACT|nr:hypothetical protein HAHE_21050 [Haloferula helveola]
MNARTARAAALFLAVATIGCSEPGTDAPDRDPETSESTVELPPVDTPLMLRAKHSDSCLTLEDTSVIQRAHGGGGQIWTLERDDDGRWKILFNGLVLGATGEDDGSSVIVATDEGQPSQRWRFQAIDESYYRIINAGSGRLLEVADESTADSAPIQVRQETGASNQAWGIQVED